MIRNHIYNLNKTICIRINNYLGVYNIINENMLIVFSSDSIYFFNLNPYQDSVEYVCILSE